jgi:hypothetical protein
MQLLTSSKASKVYDVPVEELAHDPLTFARIHAIIHV